MDWGGGNDDDADTRSSSPYLGALLIALLFASQAAVLLYGAVHFFR